MPESQSSRRNFSESFGSIVEKNAVPIAVIISILMMIIPLPKFLIDFAMVLNFALSLVIMLTVLYIRNPSDFTSFPRLTILMTQFGLGINVASTRLILLGNGDLSGQSEMVKAFADIVAGDNLVIGVVVFIILIVIQVAVITKGASRISEVQARFTLDAMNNKMFDIQNSVQSGEITAEEGSRRKDVLRRENSFYSTMDGAQKFVSGNVKAGILITVTNILGGFITGMIFGHLDFQTALSSYTRLTIGDGLLSQIPSLMLSFATGILVTGTSNGDLVGTQIKKEFSQDGAIYVITGVIFVIMGIAFHNGATFVLLFVGGLAIWLGVDMRRKQNKNLVQAAEVSQNASGGTSSKENSSAKPEKISPLVELDELCLELGYALVPLVNGENGADLIERIREVRKEEAVDLGLVIPNIRVCDQITLKPEEYLFKISGVEVARGNLKMGHFMCLNAGNASPNADIKGEKTKDPVFGLDALWIPESQRFEAEKAGYIVNDLPTIIATHLTEIIKKNAAAILTKQQVSDIVEEVRKTNSVAVSEVIDTQKFSYGEIEGVLKSLLSEQVSIRNMVTILETIGDYGRMGFRDTFDLAEKVRQALGAQICSQYKSDDDVLHVVTLSQELTQMLIDKKVSVPGKKPAAALSLTEGRKFINAVSGTIAAVEKRGYIPIILCYDDARLLVKSSIERECPGVVVLSNSEVMAGGSNLRIEILGEINE